MLHIFYTPVTLVIKSIGIFTFVVLIDIINMNFFSLISYPGTKLLETRQPFLFYLKHQDFEMIT